MIKRVNIPIYHGYLTIAVEAKLQDAVDKVDDTYDASGADAVTFYQRNKKGVTVYAVAFHGKTSLPALVHESKHVVNNIFRDRRIKLNIKNDEPECYLLGWVFRQIYDVWLKYHNQ